MSGIATQIMPSETTEDRRVRRTRKALFDAFLHLVLDRRYDRIRVADILARADVGRSTFYQHFSNKDDLLTQSMSGLLSVLADVIGPKGDRERLHFVLEHFWQNRRFAEGLLRGPSGGRVRALLARLIEEQLDATRRERGIRPSVPPRLAAIQIAAGQLELITAWLVGDVESPADVVAETLLRGSRSAATAVFDAKEAHR